MVQHELGPEHDSSNIFWRAFEHRHDEGLCLLEIALKSRQQASCNGCLVILWPLRSNSADSLGNRQLTAFIQSVIRAEVGRDIDRMALLKGELGVIHCIDRASRSRQPPRCSGGGSAIVRVEFN